MYISYCLAGVAAAVCAKYWYHAADEFRVSSPGLAAGSLALYFLMYFVWPGGWLLAFAAQAAIALGIGVVGAIKLSRCD